MGLSYSKIRMVSVRMFCINGFETMATATATSSAIAVGTTALRRLEVGKIILLVACGAVSAWQIDCTT